jgi:sRNA-binding carbon storage regulator CsrA
VLKQILYRKIILGGAKMDKAELIITALQQRIGELVSNYETQVAILRAEITNIINEKNEKEAAIQDYSDSIASKFELNDVEV